MGDNMVTPQEASRAWEIHAAVDELLHSRVEALLIAHAFLVVAYVQIVSAERFKPGESGPLDFVLVAVIVLALALTIQILWINRQL